MAEHPNVALLRKGYDAFANADMATLTELFADDIQWHQPGRNKLAGDRKGRDEVFANFLDLAQETAGTFKLEIHDILANDEHGTVLVRATGERNGKKLNANNVHTFHIKNGKVVEFWSFTSDMYAEDEFFGD